jgi:hypothetical protein
MTPTDREPPGSSTPGLPGTLTRLRGELAQPRGMQRVEALLSADEPAAAVAALSAPELFELVTQVGFADTQELIALATPAQLRGCLDLDGWDRDRLLVDPLKPWLAAVVEVGFEKVGQVWAALDPELRALFVQRHARVVDLSLGEEPDETVERPWYYTTDGYFCLEQTGDEDTNRLVRAVLDDLYRADPALARHTLMAARSEPPTELEEQAYRWRSGRMADLGYVDFHDALELFAPLEPDKVVIGEGTAEDFGQVIDDDAADAAPRALPATIAGEVVARSFLARALERIDDPAEGQRLQTALLVLTNKLLSAARVRPGDLEALRRGAGYAASTVSLGLEVIARGDVARAAAALTSVSLTRLHRVGYTVTLKLARLARGLVVGAVTAGPPAAAVVEALVALRPWMSRELDQPPARGVRPFESQADVRRVAEVLARLTVRIAVAESLGVDLPAIARLPEPRPQLDDHVRTALVRAMAGAVPSPAPLTATELRTFRATAFAPGAATLRDDVAERAHALIARWLDAGGVRGGHDQLPGLLAGWLGDLERAFGPLAAGQEIDGRFVDGVLVAATRS